MSHNELCSIFIPKQLINVCPCLTPITLYSFLPCLNVLCTNTTQQGNTTRLHLNMLFNNIKYKIQENFPDRSSVHMLRLWELVSIWSITCFPSFKYSRKQTHHCSHGFNGIHCFQTRTASNAGRCVGLLALACRRRMNAGRHGLMLARVGWSLRALAVACGHWL